METIQDSKSCSFLVCRMNLIENDPSGQPVLGVDPKFVGIPSMFSADCNLLVITIDITFDVTFNKFMPLQLFGLARSPFFSKILREPLYHSSMFISPLKYFIHMSNKVRLFSSLRVFYGVWRDTVKTTSFMESEFFYCIQELEVRKR